MLSPNHRQWLCRALCLGAIGILSACGPHQSDNASSINTEITFNEAHKPLVLAIGGFNSCKENEEHIEEQAMFVNSRHYRKELARQWGQPVSVIVTCFHKHMAEMNYYEMLAGEDHVTVKSLNWKSFILEVASVFGKDPTYTGFIYGHSWGGKLAIDTAMALPKAVDIRQLTTIDPIDPTECTPTDALMGMMTIDPEPGCLRAPRDHRKLFKKLVTKVKRWSNYFQTDAWAIHSGEIEGISDNELRSYPEAAGDMWKAHTIIDDDQYVWEKQYDHVLADVLNMPKADKFPSDSPFTDAHTTTVAKN